MRHKKLNLKVNNNSLVKIGRKTVLLLETESSKNIINLLRDGEREIKILVDIIDGKAVINPTSDDMEDMDIDLDANILNVEMNEDIDSIILKNIPLNLITVIDI